LIYLDSSALVKLMVTEAGTQSLQEWLSVRADRPMVSSAIHRAEVVRAVWRADPAALPRAFRKLRGIHMMELTIDVLETAGALPPPTLRTLDAIHVASALSIREHLAAFVAYDTRLLEAAQQAGLPATCPGSRS
jgi:predicted nucleic acid-binding protein